MNFTNAVKTCFKKYFVFGGRAQRSEFWWWMLFTFLGGVIFGIIDSIIFPSSTAGIAADDFIGQLASQRTPISDVFSLLTFIPSLSVGARRLHDIDKSGWWQILPLAPVVLLIAGFAIMFASGAGGTALLAIGGIATLATVVLLIVWWAKDSDKNDNRFGTSPKYGGQARAFD